MTNCIVRKTLYLVFFNGMIHKNTTTIPRILVISTYSNEAHKAISFTLLRYGTFSYLLIFRMVGSLGWSRREWFWSIPSVPLHMKHTKIKSLYIIEFNQPVQCIYDYYLQRRDAAQNSI